MKQNPPDVTPVLMRNNKVEHDTIDTISRIAVLENEVKNVVSELKEFRKEQKEQHHAMLMELNKLDDRLGSIEKWKWMIIGGAGVCGYLIAHIPLFK